MTSAAKILSRREVLRQRLTLQSPTGHQLHRIKNQLGQSGHHHGDGLERAHVDLIDADRLYESILVNLTPEERAVYELRYQGQGHEDYERSTWESDAKLVQLTPDSLPTMLTAAGEEVIGSARDEDGQRVEGRVVVRGKRRRLMGFKSIGERLGLSERQARSRYDSASSKIRQAVREEHRRTDSRQCSVELTRRQ